MKCEPEITSKMSESESIYGTTLSQESIKVIAESIGVGNFPDEAAKDLAEDVSYRLKEIIQVNCVYFVLYNCVYSILIESLIKKNNN